MGFMKSHKKAIKKLVPKARISDDRAELEAYKDIIYSDEPSKVSMVVKPSGYKEVSKVLGYCNEHGVAVVPWGGATNLSGALTPDREFIALDMKGLNRVLDISTGDLTVSVQAGATIEKVECALNRKGLTLGHDPWSLKSATVGGAVALDSAGNLYPKYGSAGDLVLSMKVALADGKIIDIGRNTSKSSSSPHFPSLFIGSSGMLGVILEVTFRTAPLPKHHTEMGFAFPSFTRMFEAVLALCEEGLEPGSYIGGTLPKVAVKLSPKVEQALVRMLNIKAALFVHYEGPKEVVKSQVKEANGILKKYGKRMPDRHAGEWWENRHTYFEMNSQLADENIYLHVFDLCIPEGL
ncbi:MAG: FAD-binding oxidoreductase, partial [Thermoplasmata archaeon]